MALPRTATLSLYIHVPFCTELCHYCGCNTRAIRKREPVDVYAGQLLDEIALLHGLEGRRLTHLHWGGGTPSILGPRWLETIATRLASRFDLSALKEHAIELDPRRVDKPLVRALRAIGVTRASLGVQDTSPDVQRTHRPHSAVRAGRAGRRLAARGRHPRPQHRPHVRPARPDRGACRPQRRPRGIAASRSGWRCSATRTCRGSRRTSG